MRAWWSARASGLPVLGSSSGSGGPNVNRADSFTWAVITCCCLTVVTVLLLLPGFCRRQVPPVLLRPDRVPAASGPPSETTKQQLRELRSALAAAVHMNLEMLSAHAELALQPQHRDSYWGNMGHIGQVPNEVSDFARLASLPHIHTICEIGFNAGHSSSVFLTANPSATLYSFDIASLQYSALSLSLFRRAFPTRFHWIKGSSFDTVPWFRSLNITCDLFSVDGDHSYEAAFTDFMNALEVMRPGAVMVADDVSSRSPGCKAAWQELVDAGYLVDVACADNGPEELAQSTPEGIKRWCWGTVASLTGALDAKPRPWGPKQELFGSFLLDPELQVAGQLQ